MKKFLAALTASAALWGAAATLAPHDHGHDADHSSHADCPLHQAFVHPAAACAPEVRVQRPEWPVERLILESTSFTVYSQHRFTGYLRAPPALF